MYHFKTVAKKSIKALMTLGLKAVVLYASVATAAIPPVTFQYETPAPKELNLQRFAELELMFQQKSFQPESYIPLEALQDQMNENDLAASILRKSFSTWLSAQEQDSVWRQINQAAQGFKGNVRINTETGHHDVKLKFNPVSTKAYIGYEGFANSELSYDLDDDITRFEVSKDFNDITYIATHEANGSETSDVVGIRFSF